MKTDRGLMALVLLAAALIAGCSPNFRVGELQTESRSVELGGAQSVRVEIDFPAGNLAMGGGAQKLLEADFTYNVARLRPEVEFRDGTLVVREPDFSSGFPALQAITDFRNDWDLRFDDGVPMDLKVEMGAGASDLDLTGLSLTRLHVILGAGASTIDLSGNWSRDLDVDIDAGAGDLTVQLPREVGVRVDVDGGLTSIYTSGLTKNGSAYTNEAYGVSDVTLRINVDVGLSQITLEVE